MGWRDDFDSTKSLQRASIYYEDRGSGKKGDAIIISELKAGTYRQGLKHDPARRHDRYNLMYGDVCWGPPRPGDLHALPDDPRAWGPFDTKEFPYVEIKWRGNGFTLYYGVSTASGERRGAYTHLDVERKEKDAQGREWNVSLFRVAPDSSAPSKMTATILLGIDLAWFSPGKGEEKVTEIDSIQVRGFTAEERKREAAVIETLKDFPLKRWSGYDDFFPFGIYIGYLRSEFESWAGDYQGTYGNYVRHHFNYAPSNDEVEIGRFHGQHKKEGLESYIEEMKRLSEIAKATGMRLGADVRRMMDGHDPTKGFRQVLPIARQLNKAFADDDVIVSWKIADEPGVSDLLKLACIMRALSEADPHGRPQLIEFNNTSTSAAFSPYLNLNCWDLYPVLEKRRNPWAIREQANAYRKLMPDRPMWAVLQSFETRPPASDGSYIRPSDAEMRLMAYLAIAEGANGLIWYSGWTGYGRDEGVVLRAGQPLGGYLDTLKQLGKRLIPLGKRLLSTDPLEDASVEVEQLTYPQSDRGIALSVLKDRKMPISYLVAVNEDLDHLRSARVTIPDALAGNGKGIFDLYELDGNNLAQDGVFTVNNLAGGDGRIYLAAEPSHYNSIRKKIRCDTALEQIRVLTPDITISRRWGLELSEVDRTLQSCRRNAQQGADDDALSQEARARALLFTAIENHSALNATRRALEDIRTELAEISRIAEHFTKNPRWWTGRDHPVLIPNPNFKELSKRYFEVGRAYRKLHLQYLQGDHQGLWQPLNKTRLQCLKMREDILSMLRRRLDE